MILITGNGAILFGLYEKNSIKAIASSIIICRKTQKQQHGLVLLSGVGMER